MLGWLQYRCSMTGDLPLLEQHWILDFLESYVMEAFDFDVGVGSRTFSKNGLGNGSYFIK